MDAIVNFLQQTGFYIVQQNPLSLVMLVVSCVLLYLAIVKQFEPLLLLPIAFGMLLTNLPGAEMYHEVLFANGHVQWELFGGATVTQEIIDEIAAGGATQTILDELTSLLGSSISVGLLDVLYLGVKLGVYPCLIFVGVGAMTDFGPLIANPKSLLLGAAAQLGIFVTYIGATLLGFTGPEASSIGIIGGADGPTAIYTTSHLAPHLLGPIAVAAYSYMALVPVIQPPIMKALTTDKERKIKMKQLRPVSKTEKILFPIIVTIFVSFLVPSAASLVGCLMLGNLMRECGVVERLSKTVQNELMNIVTIFLGVSVGATATAATFLSWQTLGILLLGIVAFGFGTAGGVLLAKLMNMLLQGKGQPPDWFRRRFRCAYGGPCVPGGRPRSTNPSNFLLMHAMGPNVAGVIGSAVAAGVLLALFGG